MARPSQPRLRGQRVLLEPMGPEHAAAIDELVVDEAVQRFTLVPVPPPAGFGARWVERYEQGWRDATRAGFAIDLDGAFAGLALAPHLDVDAREGELGYVVSPAARGRGLALDALCTLTAWVVDELGLLRVELRIDAANTGSKRVAERAGYRPEGVLRSVHFKQGAASRPGDLVAAGRGAVGAAHRGACRPRRCGVLRLGYGRAFGMVRARRVFRAGGCGRCSGIVQDACCAALNRPPPENKGPAAAAR